jgi:putative tricarboxylic transport membrane protein
MVRATRAVVVAAVLAAVTATAGCGVTRGDDSRDITMWIPNSPGGGYDQTGRAAVSVLEQNDITGGDFEVTNILGAGGSVALTRLMGAEGDEHTLMTMGLGVVGSAYSFALPYKVTDATPIAQLIEDQEGVLVPADSPFRTIDDFIEAWKADPSGIAVGGGSSPGGPDHLFPMQLAGVVGIEPSDVRYVPYDGGGPLTSALLGEKISVGFSGLGEFESRIEAGELRVLAVSGEERMTGASVKDAPTLTESGIDLVFTNWRGVLAPPGISDQRRAELIADLEAMHDTPEWREALETNGWIDAFTTGDEFGEFLDEQDARVASTLEEVGLL